MCAIQRVCVFLCVCKEKGYVMPFYGSKCRQPCRSRSEISLLCAEWGETIGGVAMGYELNWTGLAQGKSDHFFGLEPIQTKPKHETKQWQQTKVYFDIIGSCESGGLVSPKPDGVGGRQED